jgi:APA family basic amino acid/polyamine antiporter
VGLAVAAIAALVPLDEIVELVNIGTLFAFVVVSVGVVVLRHTQPDLPRPFRCPWVPVVPIVSVLACGYLMAQLPALTWERFGIWLVIGLGIYAFYGRRHSRVRAAAVGS